MLFKRIKTNLNICFYSFKIIQMSRILGKLKNIFVHVSTFNFVLTLALSEEKKLDNMMSNENSFFVEYIYGAQIPPPPYF